VLCIFFGANMYISGANMYILGANTTKVPICSLWVQKCTFWKGTGPVTAFVPFITESEWWDSLFVHLIAVICL